MAASIVATLPPLPPSPLPPSPPTSPDKSYDMNDHQAYYLNTGIETPIRSPLTSGSFGTDTSLASVLDPPSDPHNDTTCKNGESCSFTRDSSVLQIDTGHRSNKRGRPARLEDYELICVLGKGCAGRVLLVREARTSQVKAMKAISKRAVLTHDEMDHTMAEASILKRFAISEPHNPFIAKLHDTFTDRENFYFVMQFYPGGDLATQMEIHGIIGHHRTRFYAADIVQGLDDLNGIIVRDLKPENILLDSRGHAVLADFGLSRDFGYRGEPKALHVVTYPGQSPLPKWAGQGAASLRDLRGVGTAEYLAPEVVKRAEYSYAVDWWSLGCIILECMIGKVPFRKEEWEAPVSLWDRILHDNWDWVFFQPGMKGRNPSYYGLDQTTWSFIDALLTKDPMWRLTEPCVKTHPYFEKIDWECVRRGEYEDPHDLQLHPIPENNTHYFPRLCLDEEPTVDMTSHSDAYGKTAPESQSPMNDNVLFMLEQAKYKAELENFTWSWEMEKEKMECSDLQDGQESVADQVEEAQSTADSNIVDIVADHVDERQRSSVVDPDHMAMEQDSGSDLSLLLPRTVADVDDVTLSSVSTPEAADVPLPSPTTTDDSRPPTPPVKDSPVRPPKLIDGKDQPSVPRPIPLSPKKPSIKPKRELELPIGLPSSGLSVSDLVSIPSASLGSPGRIVRRHKPMPSVETMPLSRLSIDFDGRITDLGDDDWEQLDSGEGLESLPNAPNGLGGSFLQRVLRRRPSTLHGSGLRRQAKRSDTSDSSSGDANNISPTKKSPKPLFGKTGGTKKALEKIKAFPMLRRPSDLPPSSYRSPRSSDHINGDKLGEVRPGNPRRHTESGWFEKRRSKKQSSSDIAGYNLNMPNDGSLGMSGRSVSAKLLDQHEKDKRKEKDKERGMMGMSRSVSGIVRGERKAKGMASMSDDDGGTRSPHVAVSAPRVELTKTPPIVWDLDTRE